MQLWPLTYLELDKYVFWVVETLLKALFWAVFEGEKGI